jgi:hypothetical protein
VREARQVTDAADEVGVASTSSGHRRSTCAMNIHAVSHISIAMRGAP